MTRPRTPTPSEISDALDRWELTPSDETDHIYLSDRHGLTVDSIYATIATWREDHPNWNPTADLNADARAIFAAFTSET